MRSSNPALCILALLCVLCVLCSTAFAQISVTGSGGGIVPSAACTPQATAPGAGGLYTNANLSNQTSLTGLTSATTGTGLAPDCSNNAFTQIEDSTTGLHQSQSPVQLAVVLAQAYTTTIYVKDGSGTRRVRTQMCGNTTSNCVRATVIPSSCTYDTTTGVLGTWTSPSGTLTQLTGAFSAWCKITMTATVAVDTHVQFLLLNVNGSGQNSYAGDGTSSIVAWGLDMR